MGQETLTAELDKGLGGFKRGELALLRDSVATTPLVTDVRWLLSTMREEAVRQRQVSKKRGCVSRSLLRWSYCPRSLADKGVPYHPVRADALSGTISSVMFRAENHMTAFQALEENIIEWFRSAPKSVDKDKSHYRWPLKIELLYPAAGLVEEWRLSSQILRYRDQD